MTGKEALSLRLEVSPAAWPGDRMTDVSFRLTLKNEGGAPVDVYPGAAKPPWMTSNAGAGVQWDLSFRPAGKTTTLPALELRTRTKDPWEACHRATVADLREPAGPLEK